MITIQQLKKVYENKTVLSIDHLVVNKGETLGLVGNNGAGKTTLFSLILDLIQATHGYVKIGQHQVNKSEGWKTMVGAFIDESFLIGYLTPEEYFYFLGELRGINKTEVDQFLVQFHSFFNNEIINAKKYIRDLSKGNQKKVGIVGALIGTPELIILDEPFANLDPTTQIKLKELIKNWSKNENITFLLSSHDLSHTTEVCSRIVALDKGEVIKDIKTTPETLKDLELFFAEQITI